MPLPPEATRAALQAAIAGSGAEVGIYYRSLAPDGDSILIDADVRMHAASTMKVPVKQIRRRLPPATQEPEASDE